MSQQEFQSQQEHSKQSQAEEDMYAQPRPLSNKKRAGAMPKYEHPSTYEDEIPPYSYRAQDAARPDVEQKQQESSQQSQQEAGARGRGFSPDGDAFENGYRPYRNMAQAPFWARRQPNTRGSGRTIAIIIVALFLLPALFKVLAVLLSIVAFFFLGFLFFALVVLAIAALLFFALRRSLRWPRRTLWRW
ncbi:MAG: hypothetical protein NVS2B12_33010 [Ktedonobacteraceae bacterium]